MTEDGLRRKPGPGPAVPSAKADKYPGAPCWSCEQVFNPANDMFCNGCNKLLPLLREANFFELLDLPVSLSVDREQLERNFQNLQRKVHPDRYAQRSEKERAFAAARSSMASEAYQTIRNSIARARYVLAMKGIDMETLHVEDPALLMEVMEEREAMETSDANGLQARLQRYTAVIDESLAAAEGLLGHGDAALVPVTHLIVRAQYFDKLAQDAAAELATKQSGL